MSASGTEGLATGAAGQYLLHDASCSRCRDLAERVVRESRDTVLDAHLRDRRVQRAVAGFNPHWKFEPMGAEVGGGAIENLVDGLSLRVWTARRLGLVSSVRVFRLALAYGVPVFGVGTLGTRPVPPPRPGEEVRVTAETALRINPGIRWAITERDDHIDLVFRDRVVELPLLTYHTVALLSQLSKRIFTPRELRGDLDVTSKAILAQVFVNEGLLIIAPELSVA